MLSYRAAHNHASAVPANRAGEAGSAESDPTPGSGSSHPRSVRSSCGEDSRKALQCLVLLGAAGTRPVLQNPCQTLFLIAAPPQQDRRQTGGELASQDLVADPVRRTKNDPGTQGHSLRDATQTNYLKQFPPILVTDTKRGSGSTRHSSYIMRPRCPSVKLFMRHYTSPTDPHG